MTKQCVKCNIIKSLDSFYKQKANRDGLRNDCKECHKLKMDLSLCRTSEYRAKYRRENIEKHLEYSKKHKEKNQEALKAYHRIYAKTYRSKNKEVYNKKAAIYKKNRKKQDPQYKLSDSLRTRLWSALKNGYKTGSAVRDLGCSIEELKKHLESKFQPGMKWENHGEWHIDHIKPLSSFDLTSSEECKKACHYSNLQPLWAVENIKKSNKIEDLK